MHHFLRDSSISRHQLFHRHPLQEQVVDTFVPNDILLGGGSGVGIEQDDDNTAYENEVPLVRTNSVVILTGANACGKVRHTLST